MNYCFPIGLIAAMMASIASNLLITSAGCRPDFFERCQFSMFVLLATLSYE
jgi:hypothetical protein